MAHTWQHKQQENASEIWGIITQRSRRELPKQKMGTLNRIGHETLQGLGTYGEAIDWTNKQVRLGSLLESNVLGQNVSNKIRQSKIGQDILDFSYHDARQGAVKWIGGKNQAAGVAANILLPDAMDFIGGVGYADNVVKAVNKYGPDLIGRLKKVPNAQDILKRGGQEANKLLDQATQGLDNILDPNAGRAFAMSGDASFAAKMPPGGFERLGQVGDRVTEGGRLKGQPQMDIFRKAVKSGDKKAITEAIDTEWANALDARYVDGRRGYYNIKRLVDDDELLETIVTKQDAIANAHYKFMKNQKNDGYRRDLFELIGDTYFNEKLLVYGKSKWKDRITDASNWLTDTQWHHIFGNREAGEFLMSAVARDPLVGVNLAKLMNKLNLSPAGVAENLMLMKGKGHNNFHRAMKKLGFEPAGKTRGALDFADFGQAIAEIAQKGHRYGDKMGDLAGKYVPPDPTYVNELFGMIEKYAEVNDWMQKLLKKGHVWVDPVLKKVVPKGTEGAKKYDFTTSTKGMDRTPELMADKIQNLLKILEEG
tara:strand:- start:151 stop:1764 length:1614 start_codon:yes stop_codon:yes gene_type:complete